MKRIISAVLIFVLILSATLISGCEKGEGDTSSVNEQSTEINESEESTVPAKKLKIGSYNIANGREVKWDFKKIADDIMEKDLDIVGLQEIDQFCKRSLSSDTMRLLSIHTGMKYYTFFKCIKYDGGEYGTAILSKYPIVKSDEVELNDGTQVERRLLTHAEIDVDGTVINFYNTHLSLKDDFRAKEFGIIAEQLKNVPRAILTGDFNVDGYEEFETLAPLSYINNTETQYITFPSSKLKIDNIFYSLEFTENEEFQGILQNNHSDHVMLYSEFEFIPEK